MLNMNNSTPPGSEEHACFKVDIFPLFIFAFLVNIFALLAVLKAPPRSTTTNAARQIHLLICCLSASDTVSVGLQCLMPIASFINCGWWGGQATCSLFGYLNAILIIWSAWIVALLSFQRFLCTVSPFKHQSKFTTKRIKKALLLLFLFTSAFFTPPLLGIGEFVYYKTGQFCSLSLTPTGLSDSIFLSLVVAHGFVCVFLILFFSLHVIFSLKARRRVFQGRIPRAVEDSTSTFVALTKAIAFVFCICNFPLLIRMAVDIGKQTSRDELGLEHTITMALLFANPLTNPFIYVACRKRYRNSLKLLFCRQCNGVAPTDNLAFVIVYAARSFKRGQSAKQAATHL